MRRDTIARDSERLLGDSCSEEELLGGIEEDTLSIWSVTAAACCIFGETPVITSSRCYSQPTSRSAHGGTWLLTYPVHARFTPFAACFCSPRSRDVSSAVSRKGGGGA